MAVSYWKSDICNGNYLAANAVTGDLKTNPVSGCVQEFETKEELLRHYPSATHCAEMG